jgi:hypothetical protein
MTKCTVNCIKFQSPNGHNSGKTQWTEIFYQCAHLHIRILQCTKFHELLINHVGEFAMTKCTLNCLKISKSKEA